MKKPQKCLIFFLLLIVAIFQNYGIYSQTICSNKNSDNQIGTQDGYRYELWNQNSKGEACITLGEGATFSGYWGNVANYLARRGLEYDQTKTHQETGIFYANYDCVYNPIDTSGNSYLSIYGWTLDPLIEFYIVEDWCRWIPSMDENSVFKGTIEVNGSIYDIYENTRVKQPSIVGTKTFQQYFSIRRNNRKSGTINISDHFKKWEELKMKMGKMYEVSFVVEGYKSSGSFEFKKLEIVAEK